MAKVIFEFNNMKGTEFQDKGEFYVGMNVQLEEVSPEGLTGPHDVMAVIVRSMASEIIEKATRELLTSVRERGMDVEGELFSYNPDAAKH